MGLRLVWGRALQLDDRFGRWLKRRWWGYVVVQVLRITALGGMVVCISVVGAAGGQIGTGLIRWANGGDALARGGGILLGLAVVCLFGVAALASIRSHWRKGQIEIEDVGYGSGVLLAVFMVPLAVLVRP
jgi:hypothetical protein